MYVENHGLRKKIMRPDKFIEISGIKDNLQKSIVFLYSSHEHLEM